MGEQRHADLPRRDRRASSQSADRHRLAGRPAMPPADRRRTWPMGCPSDRRPERRRIRGGPTLRGNPVEETCRKVSRTSLWRSAVMATCGLFANASRSASVRCAVSSVTSRSGSGLTASSSSSGFSASPPTVMTVRCTLPGSVAVSPSPPAPASPSPLGRLVLGADIAAIDAKAGRRADADEDAGSADLGRDRSASGRSSKASSAASISPSRSSTSSGSSSASAYSASSRSILFAQRLAAGALLVGQIDRRAGELSQPVRMAIGKIGGDLDPLPAFARRWSPPPP